jgi:hypothetical protein
VAILEAPDRRVERLVGPAQIAGLDQPRAQATPRSGRSRAPAYRRDRR